MSPVCMESHGCHLIPLYYLISYSSAYSHCSLSLSCLLTPYWPILVQQGCLLSPTQPNIFLERIMTDALEDHEGTVSIGGRTITNLRFADDIDGFAGEEEELAN